MSEIVVRRLTYCPTGRAADVRSLELVLDLDDREGLARTRVARVATVLRVFWRGDRTVLAAHGLNSVTYRAAGFPDFKVTARSPQTQNTALAGQTVTLWTNRRLDPLTGLEQVVPFDFSWTPEDVPPDRLRGTPR